MTLRNILNNRDLLGFALCMGNPFSASKPCLLFASRCLMVLLYRLGGLFTTACLFDLAIMVRWFCASELTEGIDAESKDGGIFFS